MDISIRDYDPSAIGQLHAAFLEAFSDYFVSFKPRLPQFKRRIHDKLNIQRNLSSIAWEGDHAVGFMLHTQNSYEGLQTLYNGGTGVVNAYRRNGMASRLFEHTYARIPNGIARILLEVIDQNTPGLSLYESIGFQHRKVLKCFRLKRLVTEKKAYLIKSHFELKDEYTSNFSFNPCFLDSPKQLVFNLQNERILEVHFEEQLAGHIIFQPGLGRVSQLAVKEKYRQMGVASTLLAAAQELSAVKELTIMNIPEDQYETIAALQSLGFENELNQIEMELKL